MLPQTVAFDREQFEATLDFLQTVLNRQAVANRHADDVSEIKGGLDLSCTRIRRLPGNLTVTGDVDLQQCQRFQGFESGPVAIRGDLKIGGKRKLKTALTASDARKRQKAISARGPQVVEFFRRDSTEGYCPIQELPEGLDVKGDLELRGCSELESLPSDMTVGGSLVIAGSPISKLSLQSSQSIEGDLELTGCNIESLPDGLRVTGNLKLNGLPIKSLPKRLTVGGDLILHHCIQISSLPDDLCVGGRLKVFACPISNFPESLNIGGNLVIHRCDAQELSFGCELKGSLIARRCRNLLRVTGFEKVGGNLEITHCRKLASLPDSLVVSGRVVLDGCVSLQSLPESLVIAGKMFPATQGATSGAVTWHPNLSLVGCHVVKSLPRRFDLTGSVDLADCGITNLEDEQLTGLEVRWRGVPIPAQFLFRPKSIRPEDIFRQQNAEVRRVMLERVGVERLLQISDSRVVAEDVDAGGRRRLIRFRTDGWQRDWYFLNCICPSTGREYILQVPGNLENCHAAAAWLAGFENPEDYQPILET